VKTTNSAVGVSKAKNKFLDLLDRVDRGAEITITKHGRPVAKLVPASASAEEARKRATLELRAMSKRYSLKGYSVRKLINGDRG
jgi:prevent-host-death family protein